MKNKLEFLGGVALVLVIAFVVSTLGIFFSFVLLMMFLYPFSKIICYLEDRDLKKTIAQERYIPDYFPESWTKTPDRKI